MLRKLIAKEKIENTTEESFHYFSNMLAKTQKNKKFRIDNIYLHDTSSFVYLLFFTVHENTINLC